MDRCDCRSVRANITEPDLSSTFADWSAAREPGRLAVAGCARAAYGSLSRWLLMSQDRVGADDFNGHRLGQMLGSTRPATLSAQALQTADFIRYHSGQVKIVDRAGLESVACESYWVVKVALDGIVERAPGRKDARTGPASE